MFSSRKILFWKVVIWLPTLATVKENEVAEEKNLVVFDITIAFTQKGDNGCEIHHAAWQTSKSSIYCNNTECQDWALLIPMAQKRHKRFTYRWGWSICQESMTASNIPLLWVLCVPCVLFGGGEVANDRGKYTELKRFVTNPFQKYGKISDKIRSLVYKIPFIVASKSRKVYTMYVRLFRRCCIPAVWTTP